jgi:hypothetical protein
MEPTPLPPLFQRWARELYGADPPRELKATCESCAMCASEGAATEDRAWFRPDVKCCSYWPDLANFEVGAVLSEPDASTVIARSTLDALIEARGGVTPLGVAAGKKYRDHYRDTGAKGFGQDRELLCPYFINESGGLCGIWRHREAVCATWFCKHERGELGSRFWSDLKLLLREVEIALSRWCVLQLDPGVESLRRLMATGSELKDEDYELHWGPWLGRERQFFERCAAMVADLPWSRVLEIAGVGAQVRAQVAAASHQAMLATDPSPALKWNDRGALLDGERRVLNTYSIFDPVVVPETLHHLLRYFDGRPLREVLSDIEAREGLRVSPGLVRKLEDFGVLVKV